MNVKSDQNYWYPLFASAKSTRGANMPSFAFLLSFSEVIH